VKNVSYAVTVGFTFSGRFNASKTYVNLDFPLGTQLPDPNRRLKGTGKMHRHLRVETQADLDDPELRRFIHLAADRADISGGPVALKPQVKVKGPAPKKRREPRRAVRASCHELL